MIFQQTLEMLVPLLIAFLPMYCIVWLIIRRRKRISLLKKNPINVFLLRAPGQSLMQKIDDSMFEIQTTLFSIPALILLVYNAYQISKKSNLILFCSLSISIGFLFYLYRKIIKLIDENEKLKLGYEAELAIGQELNQLMRSGFYVFHDVNLKNTVSEFNIDHIVVGSSGVFAVETKGRSKPIKSSGDHAFKVSFDGQKLIFPEHEETAPVNQARRQAESLQKWLSKAIAEPIKVKAVIALPGWYVNTTKKTDIALINGKNPDSFFNSMKNGLLTQKQVDQIAFQLETISRTIEPKAFKQPK